ncbi:acyltransferase [Phenylobacterium sp.]|uniref:acyltransferase n=1 Tax=Phenylobacterium sp. TaxID=1871053 RepID=UPI0025F8B5FD|nr:acyltransferase [Phenylobacterium sp.]
MTEEKLRYGFREANRWRGFWNRVYQLMARFLPGGSGMRVKLHRARGVTIGDNVWIGYDAIIETNKPWLVEIGDDVLIGIRSTIIAHFRESAGVKIEAGAYIGVGAIIMPNVVIGRGAVVTAGSVVTRSVPPLTIVQGNPAVAIARTEVPMGFLGVKEFARKVRPLGAPGAKAAQKAPTPPSAGPEG